MTVDCEWDRVSRALRDGGDAAAVRAVLLQLDSVWANMAHVGDADWTSASAYINFASARYGLSADAARSRLERALCVAQRLERAQRPHQGVSGAKSESSQPQPR